jgi:Peptidase family M28
MTSQPLATSSNPFKPHTEAWMKHIRALAEEIGPRGATTEGERLGHEYCRETLTSLGLEARWEIFRSAKSVFHPFLIVSLLMLLAFVIYPLAGRVSGIVAALIALFTLFSAILELTLWDNPLRRLVPKGNSQNVFTTIPAQGELHQDLVLIGHVDSQHTPIIFRSGRWLAAYRVFSTAALITFVLMTLLYLLGVFTLWSWIWPVSWIAAVFAVLLLAMCWEAVSSPFTNGANDNATAAGMILALAEHFRKEPLKHTRLWLVCTGCEEALHDGAIDFFRRHKDELSQPKAVVLESLGSAGPSWSTGEGIVLPIVPTPNLVKLAEQVSEAHPELDGYPSQMGGGVTEMTDALRAGVPAITLTGLTRENVLPFWHQVGDTVDKLDADALARNYAYTWHYIQALDE